MGSWSSSTVNDDVRQELSIGDNVLQLSDRKTYAPGICNHVSLDVICQYVIPGGADF